MAFPGTRKLNEGDIISIDIGAQYQGYHGDSAWTYAVGAVSRDEAQRLLDVTEASLYAGLALVKPDVRLFTISHAIQTGNRRCRILRRSGICRSRHRRRSHEEPQIPNYGIPDRGPRLKPGMVLAIEPMVNIGERYVRTLEDNWTVVTVDGHGALISSIQ